MEGGAGDPRLLIRAQELASKMGVSAQDALTRLRQQEKLSAKDEKRKKSREQARQNITARFRGVVPTETNAMETEAPAPIAAPADASAMEIEPAPADESMGVAPADESMGVAAELPAIPGPDAPAYTEEESFAPEVTERAADTAGLAVAVAAEVAKSKAILLPIDLRYKKDSDPYWQTPEGTESLRGLDDPVILLGELTETMKTVLGAKTVECIQAETKTVRDFFERSTPVTQCGNVIGDSEGEDCWICGTKIVKGDESFKPECEHVFPILQALVFTGLYETQLFESLGDEGGVKEAYVTGLKLEYKWAHRICNQVKNDAHFIVLTKDGEFGIDDAKIVSFLTKLQNTTKWGGGKRLLEYLKNQKNQDGAAYLNGRVEAIREVCRPILSRIASMRISPKDHARATAMHIKEFVANDGRCIEEAPPPDTRPTVKSTTDLTRAGNITPADAEQVVVYGVEAYARPLLNEIFGRMQTPLREILRREGKTAADRTRILSALAAAENIYLGLLQENLKSKMNEFRKRVYGAIDTLQITPAQKWSRFQVSMNQFMFAFIVYTTYTNAELFARPFPPELQPPILEAFRNADVQAHISTTYNKLLEKITQGFPDLTFAQVMSTEPKEFPAPAALPSFSGGGHLREYPSLYGNDNGPSGGSVRRGLYERLQQRAKSGTTSRVRQRARKSRTRRQRKRMDRV